MRVVAITPADREWLKVWGPKSGVVEKHFLTTKDDFPITACLRRFPKQKNLLGDDGYKLHCHPSLELCFVVAGHLKAHVEGAGEIELRQGTLTVMPAGVKHGATEALEETTLFVGFAPPYDRPSGVIEQGTADATGKKFLLVRADDTPFVRPWGPSGTVTEKRLLTKEHGYGVGFTLRYIPGVKELAATGRTELHSDDGYKFHTHPCLEASYVVKGHCTGYIEAAGDEDAAEGVFIAVPPHNKHGGKAAITDFVLGVINFPAFAREPIVVVKDGIPDEG